MVDGISESSKDIIEMLFAGWPGCSRAWLCYNEKRG
jgi:hypothetical protein